MNIKKTSFQMLSVIAATFKLSVAMENNKSYPEDVNPFLNAKPRFETPRLEKMFETVSFHPPMVNVKNVTSYETEGDLFVHFNDVTQIEYSLERGVNLCAKGKVYYIKDLKPGESIRYASNKILEAFQAIYIEGVRGFKIRGALNTPSEQYILVPKGTDFMHWNTQGKLATFHEEDERKQLIKVLMKFDKNFLKIRTKDAEGLMKIINQNLKDPLQRKSVISEISPHLIMRGTPSIEESVTEQIAAKKPFALIASTLEKLKLLEKGYSLFNHFNLILPMIEQEGFYSIKPFYLTQHHTIKCEGELMLLGKLRLPAESLSIQSSKDTWIMGLDLTVGGNFNFSSSTGALRHSPLTNETIQIASTEMHPILFNTLLQVLNHNIH